MNNSGDDKLRIAMIVVMATVALALFMNTCALDRIEKQVIRAIGVMEKSGNSSGSAVAPILRQQAATGTEAGEPGSPTGYTATGWGGKTAEILHVEGAVENPPYLLSQKPRPQNDYYVSRRNEPPGSLNFYATNEGDASTITQRILGTLFEMDPDDPPTVLPSLAMEWSVSEDKRSYTYRLRKGVLFADGHRFTAADVKFSFDVMRDPGVKAEHMRSSFDDVESLTTPDDYTVVVKYRKKYWKGIYTVGHSLRILNKGWYEEQIPVWAKKLGIAKYSVTPGKPGFGEVFNKIRIPCPGTGPYYFEGDEYEPERFVHLVQNPFYFGIQTQPTYWNFTKLRWVFISDQIAAFEAFRKKKFDITVVDFQPYDDEYSKDPTITSIANYYEYDHMRLAQSYLAWNTRQPPFDDPRVRRAMTHLTNRAWIKNEIERGRGEIAVCNSKRIYSSYSKDLKPIPFDIEAAKKLLAEAGWTDSDGDGILDRNGQRFEFELKVGSARRFYVQVGAALQDACKKAGIRMTMRTLEWSTFIQDYYERRFDAVCLYSSWQDPWIDLYDEFHSSQDVPRGGNSSGWRNKRADELLELMRGEFDPEKRDEYFHEFNRIFQQEQPYTLLMHGVVGVLMNNRFEDVKVYALGMREFKFWVKPENVLYK